MGSSCQRLPDVRLYVFIGAVLGLGLTLILAVVRDDRSPDPGDIAFVALFGGPFLLALLSFLRRGVERQRRVWLASAVLTVAAGLPLVFNGVGIFFLAIALDFAWAYLATRAAQCSHG